MTSWVIIHKPSNKTLFETFEKKTAEAYKAHPDYEALPILEYLTNLNKEIKDA